MKNMHRQTFSIYNIHESMILILISCEYYESLCFVRCGHVAVYKTSLEMFNLRLMQRFVPGATAHPEQH